MPASLGSIGEYTVVASAKRGVRGTFSDADDDPEELVEDRSRLNGSGRFFSLSADNLSVLYDQLE